MSDPINNNTLVDPEALDRVDTTVTLKAEGTAATGTQASATKMSRGIAVAGTIAVGGIILGYDVGTISGMLTMPKYIASVGDLVDANTIPATYAIPSWRSGLIVGAVSIGGLIGSFLFGKLADRFGRRTALALTTALLCISTIVQALCYQFWPAVFGARLGSGLSIGGLSAVCPMYISETAASPSLQTLLVSGFQLLLTIGILIGQAVAFGSSQIDDTNLLQFMIPLLGILVFAVPLCLVAAFRGIPESVKYLVSRGKLLEARECVTKATGLPANSEHVEQQVTEAYETHLESQKSGNASWKQVFAGATKMRYRVLLSIGIMMLQQLSGINYFFYYGTSLFKEITGGTMNPYATSMILGGVNIIGTICMLPIVCKAPRRVVLMTGSLIMFASFIVFSTLGQFFLRNADGAIDPTVGIVMIAVVCIFIIGFAGTWAPCAFVVISEMFPRHELRSKAISLAVASNWLINALITFVSPIASAYMGYAYGYVFSAFLLVAVAVVYFCVYETKGLDADQIEEMFTHVAPRNSGKWRAQNMLTEKV